MKISSIADYIERLSLIFVKKYSRIHLGIKFIYRQFFSIVHFLIYVLYLKNKPSRMILGVSYNLFDGEELLEDSIRAIRNHVEFISVVYQVKSNYGNKCNPDLKLTLQKLLDLGYINELYEYRPILENSPNQGAINETNKRNIGLELSRKKGCTHHMSMDADEFYLDSEFVYMKKIVDYLDYESSACRHLQYYKDTIYVLDPPEQEYVSLIYKLKDKTRYIYQYNRSPVGIDNTRKTNNSKYKIFSRWEVQMHHMSFIRKNIRSKLENSSAYASISGQIDSVVEHYRQWRYPELVMWSGGKLLKVREVKRRFIIKFF